MKTFLITGATSGFGMETAKLLAGGGNRHFITPPELCGDHWVQVID